LDFRALQLLYRDLPGLATDKLKAILEMAWPELAAKGSKGIIFAYDEAQNMADHGEKEQYPLSVLLDDPQLTADKQAELFIRVCGDKLDEAGKNFVHQLTQNKRLSVLPDVAVLFENLLAEHQRKQDVNVISAFELSPEERDKLKLALAKRLGKEVNLQGSVDKSLIGGVVIRAGDLVIDGSVRGQLQQLSQALR